MFCVKGECYVLDVYIMFNFKIFDYIIWPRFNDMFYFNGFFLVLLFMFKFKIYG